MDRSEIIAEYSKRRPSYEVWTAKLAGLVGELLNLRSIHATVESRTKSLESFAAKSTRDGKHYNDPLADVTDLSGLRIVTRTTLDVEAVLRVLHDEFVIDRKHSIDKSAALDPATFGYVSKHVIVRLSSPRNEMPEWQIFADKVSEVQVRTFAQHAWANISRALEYTREEDIPKPLRRRLHRLSALFEIADDELKAIWMEGSALVAEYLRLARLGLAGDVDLNVDSYLAFIRESAAVRELVQVLETMGIQVADSSLVSLDIMMLQRAGFRTIGDVMQLLHAASPWSKQFLRDYYVTKYGPALHERQLTTQGNSAVLKLLIASHREIFPPDVLEREYGWASPERVFASADRTVPQ